jgi:ABC-type polysaccharide/polyol phosphate transport system ATPase subunit
MELVAQARTMVFVSHALSTVKEMCTDAIWLEKGQIMERGTADEVVDKYTSYVNVAQSAATLEDV